MTAPASLTVEAVAAWLIREAHPWMDTKGVEESAAHHSHQTLTDAVLALLAAQRKAGLEAAALEAERWCDPGDDGKQTEREARADRMARDIAAAIRALAAAPGGGA